MIAILQLLIISTISAALARRLVSRWEPRFASASERLLFEYASGLGVLGLLLFGLGCVQLFYPPAFLALPLVVVGVSWSELSDIVGELLGGVRELRKVDWTYSSGAIAVIVGGIGLLALIRALAPPVGEDWDSLAYHLAIPKLFLRHHGIYYVPFSSHSNFPFTWEMLYTLGMGFGSVGLAKLFHFAAGVMLLWAVFSLGARYFGRKAAGLAVLILAGVPVAAWEATSGYVDLAAALYVFLAVYALLNYSASSDRRWAVMAGICAGIAAGTKMTGLAMISVVLVWVLWQPIGERRRRDIALAVFSAGVAVLIAAPWYVKTWIFTGNPVYPFFYGVFGGRNWGPMTADLYRADQLLFGMGRDAASFLMIPWNITMHFARFHDYGARLPRNMNEIPLFAGNASAYLASVGPMFLAMLPVMILSTLKRGFHRPMLAAAFALLVIWFFMSQQSRYLIPIFALLAPVAAWGAESMGVRRVMLVVAAVAAVFTAVLVATLAVPAAQEVFGRITTAEYLSGSDICRASDFVNHNTPENAKIALYGETRGFYIDRDYLWADSGHNAIIPSQDTHARIAWLKGHGYDYILVNNRNFVFEGAGAPPELHQVYTDKTGAKPGAMSVYRISR